MGREMGVDRKTNIVFWPWIPGKQRICNLLIKENYILRAWTILSRCASYYQKASLHLNCSSQ